MPGKGQPARRSKARTDPATENRNRGLAIIRRHPLFAPLAYRADFHAIIDDDRCPPGGWAVVTSLGDVYLHPRRRGEPEEWAWVAAHCLLHLGFDHLAQHHLAGWRAATGMPSGRNSGARFEVAWSLAACVEVDQFLSHLKIGRPPEGPGGGDLSWEGVPSPHSWRGPANWPDLFAAGLASAVGAAVDVAGGVAESLAGEGGRKTQWRQALSWLISSYPLLGALAAAFKLVEDAEMCRLHGIGVAAISPAAAELYANRSRATGTCQGVGRRRADSAASSPACLSGPARTKSELLAGRHSDAKWTPAERRKHERLSSTVISLA